MTATSRSTLVRLGVAQALGVGLVLHLLHAGHPEAHPIDPTLHWLRDSSLAMPASLTAVVLGAAIARRATRALDHDPLATRLGWALVGAVAYAVTTVPGVAVHERLFGGDHHESLPFALHAAHDGTAALGAAFVVLVLFTARRGVPWEPRPPRATGRHRVPLAAAAVLAGAATLPPLGGPATPAAHAAGPSPCGPGGANETYDVVAVNVAIPYNRWGDVNPAGQVFVLAQDRAAVENWSTPLAADPAQDPARNRRLRPRPLVLRANEGDCVQVNFTNDLADTQGEGLPQHPRASLHVQGPAYDARTSDGGMVGFNADTTVPNHGGAITYFWQAPAAEGLYLFKDQATPAGSEADGGSAANGLYGALAVEPAGSAWFDSSSGRPLYSGTAAQSGDLYVDAIIAPPAAPAFRETVQLAQDEIPSIGLGFNYGSEPQRNRDAHRCADCVGEETSLSSWPYGDPALVKLASGPGPWLPGADHTSSEDCGLPVSCYVANVTHDYVGDPAKIRFGLAGVKETHVFHFHAHQWLAEPKDLSAGGGRESTTIDSQSFGPGEAYTVDILFGAGSKPGTFGDSIYHCHLYPHFAKGFWGLFRVHDVAEQGSAPTPDGVMVRPLAPLPDRAAAGMLPPQPSPTNPGYPRFIPGRPGWRAPQPPGGVTRSGPAGPPAPRIVAGLPLDPSRVAVEQAVQSRNYGGAAPKPGAPFRDPCPAGAREVTYDASVLQRDIVHNEAGWHDAQGRLIVLDRDVAAVQAGTKAPEPLFIRVNAGDCVNYNLTNLLPNWVGGDAFVQLAQANMMGEHIHLVKFDVLGSDGSTNGWNYQEAAFTKDQADYDNALLNGIGACDEAGGCRLPLPASWNPAPTGVWPGQTIHERWYADYELRTVFTHDHHFPALDQGRGIYGALIVEPAGMDVRDPRTGAWFQPVNDPSHGTPCGQACEGGASGALMDVIGPKSSDDFREYGLAFADFVELTRAGGDPRVAADTINPPKAPEQFPDNDPGVMAINYRNAPLLLRQTRNGTPVDPAYAFSSWVFGDPQTPLLQAYAGDRVRLRLIQGAQEEQHVLTLNGLRWRHEPDDPQSPLVASQTIGISEAFNLELPAVACGSTGNCQADYLYSSAATDDTWLGMWGILRVSAKQRPGLLPLPDNVPRSRSAAAPPAPTGKPPPPTDGPGQPCPPSAPHRFYSVVAMEAPLAYNEFGDHDPHGLVYALASDEATIRAGRKPQPLVLRAAAGDCIDVTLTNKLTTAFLAHHGTADGDPALPLEPLTGTPAGLRVSLHPQLVSYDVRRSDGATVGYNLDQTVGPGRTIQYRWYADPVAPGELGASNLLDAGDLRGHRHHGLFAGLVVEPAGAGWYDPVTGAAAAAGTSVAVRAPGGRTFREFDLFFQDGLDLRDATGAVVPDPKGHLPVPGEVAGPEDSEDQGHKGFNYASAPFDRRLGTAPIIQVPSPDTDALSQVFSSVAHGDPLTPIFRAYAGDPVRIRVFQGGDKPRQHAFQLGGHAWLAEPDDPGSNLVAASGGLSVGRVVNVQLPGAGGVGAAAHAGDYRYGCAVGFNHQSEGLWGIFRVYPPPPASSALRPTPLGAIDDPLAGGHPILPLVSG